MSRLKQLIHEVHRRSLWQVLGIYVVGAWIGYEVIQGLTEGMGLPAWFPSLAVVLFIIGLPIVLATAFVQEGVGRRDPSGEVQTTSGGTPIPATAADENTPHRLFTWRNAFLGGVIAFALWGIVGTGWLLLVDRGEVPGAGAGVASSEAVESIAVLPFVNMSDDASNEYFSEGISEELLNLLAKIPGLQVAARTSSFSFKGQNLEIPEIAERLHVAHVLEGSVRKAGNQVRITAQLIRAADGFHVWSETWNRSLDDIFAIQDEIAADVVAQLKITLLGEAPTVEQTDPEAYALLLQARQLGRQGTAEGWEQSNALYQQALAMDPDYAAAWVGLARNYGLQAGFVLLPSDETYRLAREAANRALAIDPEFAEAYAALSEIATSRDGDLEAAARHLERALELSPADTDIIGWAARLARDLGRLDQAIALQEYRVARDPVNPDGHFGLGLSYLQAGRPDEAIAAFRTSLSLSPGRIGAQAGIGTALLLKGEPEAALAEMEQESSGALRLIGLARAYHALGRAADSDATLAELIEKYEQGWAYNIAYVLAYRGEADLAFEWLDKAVEYNDPGLSLLAVPILFANIHDDPRWLPFLESIGKSPEQLAAIEFNVTLPK
jgi:TolB-like protein/Tfp pilus assembly protein PilF